MAKFQYYDCQHFSNSTNPFLFTLKLRIAALPVVLVRFKIRSSSSLTNGELVARGLVTAVFT